MLVGHICLTPACSRFKIPKLCSLFIHDTLIRPWDAIGNSGICQDPIVYLNTFGISLMIGLLIA